ncbi:heavy metal translocating P-type ATPase [Weissella koreensis]|uniref:Cd(2+)-exporting ATPase n=1 Tax=Weissella koreensis TaxID=165096 RepID=A0A7H1MJX9_9LACO|nr:heavy metal translocating P-type ATPase [Weissella koreensis]AVH74503.1 heavy metal translocating P-type ATPase [Weissella koreensis]QGN19726.1 cadmium-translocating P-type ATPase [Weissella koreensis]QNT63765.1 cadmium-translocating P-type ATPase [Weissella koreensis]
MYAMQNLFKKFQKENLIGMSLLLFLSFVFKFGHLINLSQIMMLLTAIVGILPILIRAFSALKYKSISIELLVSIAVIGALLIHEYDEAGIVVWLFAIGDWLQMIMLNKTRQSIRELMDTFPTTALKISTPDDRQYQEVDIDELVVDQYVLVKSGSTIPVDGVVVQGSSYVNEASITGESKPAHKKVLSKVFAGTIVNDGTIVVQVIKIGDETVFGKLIELIEDAQDSQTKEQRFVDKFARYYTPVILVLGIIVALWTKNMETAITVLVLGCPGALVIGVPVSTVMGIGMAAKNGIITKGAANFNILSRKNYFIFDKTGTLTVGEPTVVNIQNLLGDREHNIKLLASVENESNHPLARAILNIHNDANALYLAQDVKSIAGQGMRAQINHKSILVGNQKMMKTENISIPSLVMNKSDSQVILVVDRQVHMVLMINDQLRPQIKENLDQIKQQGAKKLMLLSGDNQAAVDVVANKLPFDTAIGNLLPADKLAIVKKLQVQGESVVFVGDGINDGPALSQADLGISMGGGTDIAIDVSDLVLVNSDPVQISLAIKIAHATMRNMKQNIFIALATVLILLVGLFTNYVDMSIGMLVHELSVLLVVINALSLNYLKSLF